jgi:transposase
VWPAEVARRVGVTRQSVLRWTKLHAKGGMVALRRPKRFGRPPKLDEAQRAALIKVLKSGALAAGFATELWTLPRVGSVIRERFGVELSIPSVWRMLQQLGWSVRRPAGRARERDERAIRTWKERRWPALKKIAARQGRIIVFIDESGLSERPCRARTWAPRGETPILQYSFSWKQLSVIAGISFWRF